MRSVFIVTLTFVCLALAPYGASAHQARFVDVDQHDITTIIDPDLSQAFYGELSHAPHLFEFVLTKSQSIYTKILVPDIDGQINDKSGIILKVEERGVTEITRLHAKDADWIPEFEWFGGDSYRNGPSYYDALEPGVYQIEISTPVNLGKYVLVVGKREEFNVFDYITTIRDIARIKSFFGKSPLTLIETPFLYIPLIFLSIGGVIAYRRWRRTMKGL